MSTVEDSGLAASEHKPEPADAAGCKAEVDRSVSWTAPCAGFAELRARTAALRDTARENSIQAFRDKADIRFRAWSDIFYHSAQACSAFDALEADAKYETRREVGD
jgi:hypothetical protein